MENIFNQVIDDQDESLRSKSGGSFGLNLGFITKLEYNASAGKDNSEGDAVDIAVQIADKEFRRRIYDATSALFGANNTKIEPNEEGYAELYKAEMAQRMAVVTHAVKATGVTVEALKASLSAATDFKSWAGIICSLPPVDFKSNPVDVFLEYQWNISESQDRTYLELPKNMKGGYFLCPAQNAVGSWKPVTTGEGMKYVDDASNEHPFTRSTNYMKGNKANQQIEGQEQGEDEASPASAAKSDW